MRKFAFIFKFLFRNGRRLFEMLIGILFLMLALAGATVSFSEWQHYAQAPSDGLVHFVLYAVFTVILIIFSLYSFAKARSMR